MNKTKIMEGNLAKYLLQQLETKITKNKNSSKAQEQLQKDNYG